MIYTKISHLERYLGLSSTLDAAIRYLQTCDLNKLNQGRNVVDGDLFFINRFGYETVAPEEAKWEGHAQYADIHVLLSGRERIGVSPADELLVTGYKPEADFVGFEGTVRTWFIMNPGDVLILFPEDAHMVKVMDGESTHVDKACFKIKVCSVGHDYV